MYLLFATAIAASLFIGYKKYEGSYVQYKIGRFRKLVNTYYHEEKYSYPVSLYKSFSIVLRSAYIDFCTHISIIKSKSYSFVRIFQGGSVYLLVVKNKSGPKRILEYAYFGEERMDHVMNLLLGPNRDFNGNPDVLTTIASNVRYKFIEDDHEIIVKDEFSASPDRIDREIIKKILSMSTLENFPK